MKNATAYPHDMCPVCPEISSHGTPVWVGENAISCMKCAATGTTLGSRRPGYFPFSALCGSHEMNEIALMVENFTHWAQAQIVLEARAGLKGKIARLCYDGMLRLRHAPDDRIDRVFRVAKHVVRGSGRWVTPGRYESLREIRATLAGLPACTNRDGKTIPERLDMFDQPIDLSSVGYTAIRPLRGMRIFGEFLNSEGGPISIVLPPPWNDRTTHPKYLPADRRIAIDEARRRVEVVFPDIEWNYLLLLIAARGVAEGEIGLAPNILCTGPSGTGKTAIAELAASMIGDKCTPVEWVSNPERFRQAYQEGADLGGIVTIDELIKCAHRSRTTARQAFDAFLTLTPNSLSHKLYHGAVPLGRLPVTIVTETSAPNEVRADLQLARRFVYVRLDARVNWEETLKDTGVRLPSLFRQSSQENAEASNAVVSYVIDRFFREKVLTLTEIAEQLGYTTLEHCDEAVDDPDALPRLFEEVCKAKECDDGRQRGRGWVKIAMIDETTLAETWKGLCDNPSSSEGFATSRRVKEVDWSTIIDVPIGTRCYTVRGSGQSVLIRFCYGATRGRGDPRVNAELLTCEGKRRDRTTREIAA